MIKIYLDFETFYSSGYTLSKMSSEEYIRDPRFEAMCLAVAINDGPVKVYPPDKIAQVVAALPLERPDVYTFAHNMGFDGFILTHIYGKFIAKPINVQALGRWTGVSRLTSESQSAFCDFLGTGRKWEEATMIMKGKHWADMTEQEQQYYMTYCGDDVEKMRANCNLMLPLIPQRVLDFIAMSKRMYTTPILSLDKEKLLQYRSQLLEEQENARLDLLHLFSFPEVDAFLAAIRSKDALVKMFEQLGATVPYKLSEKKTATKKAKMEAELEKLDVTDPKRVQLQAAYNNGDYNVWEPAFAKTDEGFIALMESDDPRIAALACARAENNSSIALSRCETFLRIADRGLLPVPLEPFRAWTGRYTARGAEGKSDATNLLHCLEVVKPCELREHPIH